MFHVCFASSERLVGSRPYPSHGANGPRARRARARRVEFLQCVLVDPTLERRFQRTVALVKWALFLSLGTLLLILGQYLGWANLLEL